jgi:hypothetical protein
VKRNEIFCYQVINNVPSIDFLSRWQGISFVKISNPEEAKEYGIDDVPSLIYFENGIPSIYEGKITFYTATWKKIFLLRSLSFNKRKFFIFLSITGDLKNEEQVLDWLIHQVESDEIEDVTDEMLDMLIKRSKHLAVLFCNAHHYFVYIS